MRRPEPRLSMTDVAEMMGLVGADRGRRALRHLQRMEKRRGVRILFREGEGKGAPWWTTRAVIATAIPHAPIVSESELLDLHERVDDLAADVRDLRRLCEMRTPRTPKNATG